jgi:mannose-6-phosphate isomerase-like protein (cupin superfamily)
MTQNERALQDEVDRLRGEKERTEERVRSEVQERRRVQGEEYEAELHTATNWHEALIKQRALFRREAKEEIHDDDPDHYFTVGVQAIDKALEIWNTVNAERQDEISEIKQRLVRIENEIRLEVAHRLEQAGNHAQYHDVAFGIRENDIDSFLIW